MRLWIDTDGGVDDALALTCAFAAPGVVVEAVSTVFGNVAPARAARNAALIHGLTREPDLAILTGAEAQLSGVWNHARDVHGEDGLGGITRLPDSRPASHLIETPNTPELARRMAEFASRAGPADALIAMGPLTNLAHAIRLAPDAFGNLPQIIVMGGCRDIPHPRRGDSEFNFGSDLDAAETVLSAGLNLTVLPLEACRQVVLRRRRLQHIARQSGSRIAEALNLAHQHYMDVYRGREGIDGCYPHDALAIALAVIPDSFKTSRMLLQLDREHAFRGKLTETSGAARCHLVTRVDMREALNWIELSLKRLSESENVD